MFVVAKTKMPVETLYWSSLASVQGECTVIATEQGVCWMGTPGTSREAGLAWLERRLQMLSRVENDFIKQRGAQPAVDHKAVYAKTIRMMNS